MSHPKKIEIVGRLALVGISPIHEVACIQIEYPDPNPAEDEDEDEDDEGPDVVVAEIQVDESTAAELGRSMFRPVRLTVEVLEED